MKNNRIKMAFIIVVALSGVIINASYGIDLFRAFFDPQHSIVIREILISAIVLEFGWTALLVWLVFKPFERRHILLFTIIPILLGNILHCSIRFDGSGDSVRAIALNLTFGLLYSALYVGAYLAGNPEAAIDHAGCSE